MEEARQVELAELLGDMNQEDVDEAQEDIDYHSEVEEMDPSVKKVFDSNIQKKTRESYHLSMAKFVVWIYEDGDQSYLHDSVLISLHEETGKDEPDLSKVAKSYVALASPHFHPIKISTLKVTDFIQFLISM
jgi:hypothetical protein